MNKMSATCCALAAGLFLAISAFAQGNYKLESVDASTASEIPQALRDALSPQGGRVVGGQGPVCEVWLLKSLPTRDAAAGAMGVLYATLRPGAVVGVFRFASQSADFRGQPIKAGTYTLRYALIPQDGAHMGVYQSRDALLLSPVSEDKDVGKDLSFDEMVKLSRLASGTPHPAFLVMGEVQAGEMPSLVEDYSGYTNLQLAGQSENGDLPLAITVVGKWEGM